jgi:hypothetical protein
MNDAGRQPRQAHTSREAKMRWTSGVPLWVKVFVSTALGLAHLVVVLMLLSGGRHGPGRHPSSAEFDGPVVYSAEPRASSAQTTRRP